MIVDTAAQATVEAKVLAQLPDGKVRIELNAMKLELRPPQPVPTGATVRLTVQGEGAALRVQFAPPAAQSTATGQGVPTAASSAQPASGQSVTIQTVATLPASAGPGPIAQPGQPAPGQIPSAASASAQPAPALAGQPVPAGQPVAVGQPATGVPAGAQPAVALAQPGTQPSVQQPATAQTPITQIPGPQTSQIQTPQIQTFQTPTAQALSTAGATQAGAPQPLAIDATVLAQGQNGSVKLQLPAFTADIRSAVTLATGETLRLQPQVEPSGARLIAAPAAQSGTSAPLPVLNARNLPLLQPGAELVARVVGQTPAGTTQFQSGAATFELRLPAGAPQPGTTVSLKVAVGGPAPQVTLPAQAAPGARETLPPDMLKMLRQVAEVARPLAATKQDSMTPLFANVAGLVRSGGGGLPATVQKALQDLLGFRMSASDASQPAPLKQAVQRSGIFQEANLVQRASGQAQTAQAGAKAALPQGAGQAAVQVAAQLGLLGGTDLKTSLMQLRGALLSFLGEHAAPATRKGAGEPPPRAGGLPRGQMPSQPTIPESATPREAARILLSDTDAALARVRLSQMASMGGSEHAGAAHRAAAQTQEWNFELPLALGNQTAVAQFQIARDGGTPARRARARRVGKSASPSICRRPAPSIRS
ncbi:hypothetical protein [Breoghania sp. L-A4]|uniref:hypothetical protein n=1 Tax=Breoghania sp. L-A4 TaxID=2304600 RepID=UPI0020BD967D|nr:hypothetical protein [Breoghania sp. L-A4]